MQAKASRSALILAFATIYLVWGSTYLGIRIAVESLPPFLMASLRFAVAGSLLLLAMRILQGPLNLTWRQLRDNAITGGFLLLGGNGLVSWAEQYIPSGITAMIIGSQPLVMVLTEWAWPGGKRPGLVTSFGLLLGFAGVVWLVAPWKSSTDSLHLPGVVAILGACIFWAFGSIYSRNSKKPATPFVSSALQMLAGSALLTLVALLNGEWAHFHPAEVSLRSWLALSYLTAIGSLVGFSTFAWLMKHSTPAQVSTYAYVNPVVAIFLGWLVLGEPIGMNTLIASAVIVTAVVIITLQKWGQGETC